MIDPSMGGLDDLEGETSIIVLDPRFPVDDVTALGRMLEESGRLIPGFIPAPDGLFDIRAHRYATDIAGIKTYVVADRNIVTLLAQVAQTGGLVGLSEEHKWAVRLMAVCQAHDIGIDPSLSYHELAHRQGDGPALDELQWFRVADRGGDALAWIDLALDRTTTIDLHPRPSREEHALSSPPRRWKATYAAALKIADLEMESLRSRDRMKALLQWMHDDFLFSGPAALFAAVFFAPGRPRKLLSGLRSDDRERAIGSVRNAAWDITYMSDFNSKIRRGEHHDKQYIFATWDAKLAVLTGLTLLGPTIEDGLPSLADALSQWWEPADASRIASMIFDSVIATAARPTPIAEPGFPGIDAIIDDGEARIRGAWPRPKADH